MPYQENGCNKYLCCINASDTNKTLETTFRFILEHQINPDASINYTNIYLGISSLKSLSLSNPNNREVAFNIISGTIKKVTENYVVVLANSACTGKFDKFVIAYSDIENLNSTAIAKYYSEYILALKKLPPICVDCNNSYYNILESLKAKLAEIKDNPNLNIFIIYANIFSQQTVPSSINIIKNLLIFDEFSVVPITTVGGFFTVPATTTVTKKGGAL